MKKKILIKLVLLLTFILITMNFAEAYTIPDEFKPFNEPFDITDEIQDPNLGARGATVIVLQLIAGGLLFFAAPVAIIMIVIASFRMVAGGSESEQVDQAKKSLTWAVVGLLLVILSYSAVRAVIAFIISAAEVTTLGTN